MNKISQQEQEQLNQNCYDLIQSQQTLLLSTVTAQGEPESSYAPYVRDAQGVFYIYVSDMAAHTKNMLVKGTASILFIQPEQETKNLFARERVTFNCAVSKIKKTDERYHQQLQKMKQRFGETIDLLRSLSDFHLIALTAVKGRYIAGFGKVFFINTTDGTLNFND